MRNIRLIIAYHGTAYSGWQIQPTVPTIQGEIERRLQHMTGEACRLRVAGRTDAGVHARGQMANFHCESAIPLRSIYRGLNALLPSDIAILAATEVDPDFDSRRNNHGKHYRYQIWNARSPSPPHGPVSWHLNRALDAGAMAAAGQHLVGTHDFQSFRAANCDSETTVRTLYRCSIGTSPPLLEIDVEGTAFLKNMVRIIVGTLVEVGRGTRETGSIVELLRARDRTRAGLTAPAHGLTLMEVFLK